jgi:hypothetical protein
MQKYVLDQQQSLNCDEENRSVEVSGLRDDNTGLPGDHVPTDDKNPNILDDQNELSEVSIISLFD